MRRLNCLHVTLWKYRDKGIIIPTLLMFIQRNITYRKSVIPVCYQLRYNHSLRVGYRGINRGDDYNNTDPATPSDVVSCVLRSFISVW